MTKEGPADLQEFVWIWNRRHGQRTPAVHRRILRWLEAEAPSRRLLLMAFRGCGKSTLMALFCAWSLYRRPDLRILVLAAEQSLAAKLVAHTRRILERHPLCARLLPEGVEGWAADRFTVVRDAPLRDPSMLGQGLGGNITGMRADMILCDDVEVPGNCDTPGKRAELRERLAEAEFILTPGGLILYAGTPHTEESLYREGDEFLVGYRRLVVPILDGQGRSAWPERFDEDAVAALRRRVGPIRFARQMMLEP
ncbi:MAG: phage terminase large subunit, partial [Roseococcus sp.]